MAELADALVLGTSGRPCRFKSCYPQVESVVFTALFSFSVYRIIYKNKKDFDVSLIEIFFV